MSESASIYNLLDDYLLSHDIAPTTADYYRRVVSVFCTWYGKAVPITDLSSRLVNQFLAAKQDAGKSSYYRKSLRNGLRAILRELLKDERIRPVRLDTLNVQSWTGAEVAKLITSCIILPPTKRSYFQRLIAVAYHTGLSQRDLHLLTWDEIRPNGLVICYRAKTRRPVIAWIPPELVGQLPKVDGPIFPLTNSVEQFRKDFKRVVKAAGLIGTFKKLRKSSGTAAEIANGRGHEHLANSRKVFEAHYLDRNRVHREPVRLELPQSK